MGKGCLAIPQEVGGLAEMVVIARHRKLIQSRGRRGSGGRGQNGRTNRTANPISGSKGTIIAVVVGCAIAAATTALLPSTELSITDRCQSAGPI